MDCFSDWAIILAALYAPGAPHGVVLTRARWPQVLGLLRATEAGLANAVKELAQAGLVAESLALDAPGCVMWAEAHYHKHSLVTAVDEGYPARWLSALQGAAPPVFWVAAGSCRSSSGELIGVVGSRDVAPEVHVFCADVAREAASSDRGIVSGGAIGCDQAARRAALGAGARVVTILPFGIELAGADVGEHEMALSVCAPAEIFSTGRAMERNWLIYAASELSVVGHCRLRLGGSWHGAVGALRKRTCRVAVRLDHSEPGLRALAALGAVELDSPGDLTRLIEDCSDRYNLFAGLKVG
jgi:predicted Rossmann fold nucleotide-binding protein DprA/Smf involved in DNA uptake